jgi:hypothetical protein
VLQRAELQLVIPLTGAGMVRLGGEQVTVLDQFVALDGGVVVDGLAVVIVRILQRMVFIMVRKCFLLPIASQFRSQDFCLFLALGSMAYIAVAGITSMVRSEISLSFHLWSPRLPNILAASMFLLSASFVAAIVVFVIRILIKSSHLAVSPLLLLIAIPYLVLLPIIIRSLTG